MFFYSAMLCTLSFWLLPSILFCSMTNEKKPITRVTINNNSTDPLVHFRTYCATLCDKDFRIPSGKVKGITSGDIPNGQFSCTIKGPASEKNIDTWPLSLVPAWEFYLLVRENDVLYEYKEQDLVKKGTIPYIANSKGYVTFSDKLLEVGRRPQSNIVLSDIKHEINKWTWQPANRHPGQES